MNLAFENNQTFILRVRGTSMFPLLKDKKVVLNQSLLSKKDVLDFEYESRSKVFYNMPPLDEREKDIFTLNAFLVRLGFTKQQTTEEQVKKNKLKRTV